MRLRAFSAGCAGTVGCGCCCASIISSGSPGVANAATGAGTLTAATRAAGSTVAEAS